MARKAVLIGASYSQNVYVPTLDGVVNDVLQAKSVLTSLHGFAESDVWVLVDDPLAYSPSVCCSSIPTRATVLAALDWLVKDVKAGDVLFFHYSGHGTREPSDLSSDGLEEALLPSDATFSDSCGYANLIQIGAFKSKFAALPKGVTCVFVFDTAFQGSDRCTLSGVQQSVLCRGSSTKVVRARGVDNVASRMMCRWLKPENRFASIQFYSAVSDPLRCFALPSAWFASGERQTTWEVVIGCKAVGLFSHHLYQCIINKAACENQNARVLSSVFHSLSTAGFSHTPEFVSVEPCKTLDIFLPVVSPSVDPCCARPCCVPPAPEVCVIPAKKTEELLTRELVRLLGVRGLEISTIIKRDWRSLSVDAQICLYREMCVRSGVEAVKAAAELAGDLRFIGAVPQLYGCFTNATVCDKRSLDTFLSDFLLLGSPRSAACCPQLPATLRCPPLLTKVEEVAIACLKKEAICKVNESLVEELSTRLARIAAVTTVACERQCIADRLYSLVNARGHWIIRELLLVDCSPLPAPVCPAPVCTVDPCCRIGPDLQRTCVDYLDARQANFVKIILNHVKCPDDSCRVQELATRLVRCSGLGLSLKEQQSIIDELAALLESDGWCTLRLLFVNGLPTGLILPEKRVVDACSAAVTTSVRLPQACCEPLVGKSPHIGFRELVRLLGVQGYEIAVKVKNQWTRLSIEERKCIYKFLYLQAGMDAVEAAAAVSSDVCYMDLLAAAVGEHVQCERAPCGSSSTLLRWQLLNNIVSLAGARGYELALRLAECGGQIVESSRKEIYAELLKLGGVSALAIGARLAEDVTTLKGLVDGADRVRLVRGEPAVGVCEERLVRRKKEQDLLHEAIVLAGCLGYELALKLMEAKLSVSCRREIYYKLFVEGGIEAVLVGALLSADDAVIGEFDQAGADYIAFVKCPTACTVTCRLPRAPVTACEPAPSFFHFSGCESLLDAEQRRIVSALYYLASEDDVVRALALRLAIERKSLSEEVKKSLIGQIVCKTGVDGLVLAQSLASDGCDRPACACP